MYLASAPVHFVMPETCSIQIFTSQTMSPAAMYAAAVTTQAQHYNGQFDDE